MESNPATLAGAVRSAMRCIGQSPQRTRWADLAPRSGWLLVVQPKAINLIVSKGAEQLYGFLEPMLFYRPSFRDHRTSLCSTCGQPDHGVKHASPANAKNRSNGSIITSFGINCCILQNRVVRFANHPAMARTIGLRLPQFIVVVQLPNTTSGKIPVWHVDCVVLSSVEINV